MSTLRRLERLTGNPKTDLKTSDKDATIDELRRRVETIMSRRPVVSSTPSALFHGKPLSLESLINGKEMENDWGKFFLAHDLFPGSHRHGCHHLRTIADINMQSLSLLANHPDIIHFQSSDALFLDTETTGLAGGTGTLPFLIGMGWFEGESFVIKQIFIRDFKEERAALVFFLELAQKKRFLVTFNGKAFDIGLLSTRLVMNRLHNPISGLPHLDLLHPSRRLLGHRTDNSRLATIEESILGFRREGDLPGSEIPQRYFSWLKNRDARLMVDVFEHNRLDVISMVTLTIQLADILKSHNKDYYAEPYDLIAASRLMIDRGNIHEARSILETLTDAENRNVAREARRILSLIFKRTGPGNNAKKIWEMMMIDDPFDFFATVELAKWFEHREHDFKSALNVVRKALSQSGNINIIERESLNHRLNRLQIRNSNKKA